MLLPAKNRQKLARLVILSNKSHRQIAGEVGWKAHSMLSQLINGQRNTLDTDKATLLCLALRCDVTDLFLPKLASQPEQIGKRTAARKKAKVAA